MLKYDFNALSAEASKYSSRTEFANANKYAYSLSRKLGILDEICSHMPKRKPREEKLTNKLMRNTALKYKTRGEFKTKDQSIYNKASRLGILDEICSHMPKDCRLGVKPPNFIWDKDTVRKICKLFSTKREFREAHEGAYLSAQTNGWLGELTSHMKKSRSDSAPEKELFAIIKQVYPSAKKFRDYKVNIENKSYIKRFEIDIYIPELKLGIEFNGTYWHSFEVMRKCKRKIQWTDQDIRDYAIIKETYFNKKYGIKILQIEERNWEKNKEICINECLNFLNKKYEF